MAKMLLAAFNDMDNADQAIQELEDMGMNAKDLSIITRESEENRAGSSVAGEVTEGAVEGATTGGMIGGLAGLLAGAGIFPALAGLFIGGPIAAVLGLTGAAATAVSGAVTGAAAGGLVGALTNLGLPKETAENYEKTVQSGGLVLGVPLDGRELEDTKEIMRKYHATEIHEVETRE